jgi:hypothetical protein
MAVAGAESLGSVGSRLEEFVKKKSKTTKPGKVEKIIKPPHLRAPEKAQIVVDGADDLYKEIRIENILEGEEGETVKLKQGASVDVTIEADAKETEKVDEKQPGTESGKAT